MNCFLLTQSYLKEKKRFKSRTLGCSYDNRREGKSRGTGVWKKNLEGGYNGDAIA